MTVSDRERSPRVPIHELAARRPVWSAISELFLDTSFVSADIARIAKTLARSPYTLKELDAILVREVYPACWTNLFQIAGEWEGFDEDWLQARILRGPTIVGRAATVTLGSLMVHASPTWRRIKRGIRDIRETAGGA